VLLGATLAAIGLLAGYAINSGDRRFIATGDAFPGLGTSIAEVVGYFLAALCGAMVLGGLVYIVTTAHPEQDGVLDAESFRIHLFAERMSVGWLIAAAAMVAIQAATDSGVAVTRLLGDGGIGTALGASEMARGWIAVAICAAMATIGLRLSLRWIWHVVLLIPGLIGVIAVPVTGNAGQGPDHDYATGAVIVFSVVLAVLVGMKVGAMLAPPSPALRTRVSVIQSVCGGLALIYGALLVLLLTDPGTLLGSDYGRLSLVAAGLLLATWIPAVVGLRLHPKDGWVGQGRLTAVISVAALAAVSAMAIQTAPRLLTHQFSAWDVFLGYQLPAPPNVVRLLTFWRFDVFLGVSAVVLAAGYLAGVIRLRRRGDQWPPGRLISWLAGCAALVFVTGSGVRAYGSAMFSVHMGEHMALNMFIPIFLVLGAPVTLALRALHPAGAGQPPGPREWLLRMVHSPITGFLSHPVTAFVLFVGSLYAVYFTPLFNTLVRYHWGHEFMTVHFLLTGYLFFWGIIGIDPGPRRLPFAGRLGLLFAVMPFHAFFGVATMTMTTTIGGDFYRNIQLPWLKSIIEDQNLGGAIAWGSSELPVIVVVVALIAQWARQDRRTAKRSDRHSQADYGDDDLDAYNAMLKELSRTRR
jgi:putative copper resistance protein D